MLTNDRFVVYGGTGYHILDAEVLRLTNDVTGLRLSFNHCWHHTWSDREPGFRLEDYEEIRGRHVLIFACLANDKLENQMRDMVTACRHQYGAKSVMVVMSFMRYRRQDRAELHHEITRLRWFIRNLKHWGADRLVVCEPHSLEHTEQYCKEFGVEFYPADPTEIFASEIRGVVQTIGRGNNVKIYSPDMGSVGRSFLLAKALGLQVVATPKQRVNGRVELVEDESFIEAARKQYGEDVPLSCSAEDIRGVHMIMREDELDSGTTSVSTARRLREQGAKSVRLVVTHPVCSPGWKMKVFPHAEIQPFDSIWIGNTRPRGIGESEYEGSTGNRIARVDMAPAIAKTLSEVLKNIED